MEDLTFGEQVKIVLGRKGMTIKELAETIEKETGMKMSRQNLTQRLGRDNFQEQDMRMIAKILECPFQLSILSGDSQTAEDTSSQLYRTEQTPAFGQKENPEEGQMELNFDSVEESVTDPKEEVTAVQATEAADEEVKEKTEKEPEIQVAEVNMSGPERDMTIGEIYDLHQELTELEQQAREGESVEEIKEELEKPRKEKFSPMNFFNRIRHSEKKAEPSFDNLYVEDPQDEQLSMNFLYEDPGVAESEPQKEEPEGQEEEEQFLTEQNAEEEYDPAEENVTLDTAPDEYANQSDTAESTEYEVQNEEKEQPVGEEEEELTTYEEETEKVPAQKEVVGDVNPYTGKEYQSNSVRMHPTRIGYVQVYDQTIHKWTDMTEWAFLGYQERKKVLLGKAYEPPIYLD